MAQAHRCPDHGVVMRRGAHRRWISALGMVGAGVLIGSGTAVMSSPATSAAAESEATSPADLPEPTQKQLNNSVQRWEPGGVMEWNTADSVTPLATNKKEGNDAVITLASDILFDFNSAEISDKAEKAIAKTVENVPDGTKVDRKSTRLNSSHVSISYAVFCLKKKNLQEWRRVQRKCIRSDER